MAMVAARPGQEDREGDDASSKSRRRRRTSLTACEGRTGRRDPRGNGRGPALMNGRHGSDGAPLITYHFYWTMGDDIEPQMGYGDSRYRVVIKGDPPLEVRLMGASGCRWRGLLRACPGQGWSAPPRCRRSATPGPAWSPISTSASYNRAAWCGPRSADLHCGRLRSVSVSLRAAPRLENTIDDPMHGTHQLRRGQ